MLILQHMLYVKDGHSETPVAVRIYKPALVESQLWRCQFEIDWPQGITRCSGAGIDALQALTLTLQIIGAHIYTSDYHKQGRLRAYEHEAGYGFPITDNLRDMLIGVDRPQAP